VDRARVFGTRGRGFESCQPRHTHGDEGLEKKILYFEEPGPGNTDELLRAARARVDELRIRDVVVATTHGGTALKAKKTLGLGVNVVAVSIAEGFSMRPGWCMTGDERRKLNEAGIKVLTASHALGDGVGSAFTEKYGGKPTEEVVRETLYRFCQGMKVCVEVVLMAADAGMIAMDRDVMSIAGTSEGADTCIVVKPAYPRTFLDLEVREIVAKPRVLT
jgi:hypothetical protein